MYHNKPADGLCFGKRINSLCFYHNSADEAGRAHVCECTSIQPLSPWQVCKKVPLVPSLPHGTPLELFRWDIPSSLRGCIRSQIMLPFTFLDSTADLKSLCKQKWLLRKWWNNQTGTNDSAWLTEGIQRCIEAAVLTGKALCHSVLRCSAVPRCNSLFQDFVSGT